MLKYDFEVDLSENTSTGLILKQIKKESVVLEFGCAAGRMTRYMKEVLNCRVYIVEYDKEAFSVAIQYAEDGICEDIMLLSWAEQYKDLKFDAVIFADVLEHLPDPATIAKEAAKLLKEDGKLFFSIPNITHNDVILKAVQNSFDYSAVGLLDESHIHFWGYNNLIAFAKEIDLYVADIAMTYCKTGKTEQLIDQPAILTTFNPMLLECLEERIYGEVYQFVVTLSPQKGKNTYEIVQEMPVQSHIYLNTGKGFNAEEVFPVDMHYMGGGEFIVLMILKNVEGVSEIRFDPIEGRTCIMKSIVLVQSGKELSIQMSPQNLLPEGSMSSDTDPWFQAKLLNDTEPVIIEADFVLPGTKYQEILSRACLELQQNVEKLREEILQVDEETKQRTEQKSSEIEELQNMIQALQKEYEKTREENGELIALCKERKEKIDCLSQEYEAQSMETEKAIREYREELAGYQEELQTCQLRNRNFSELLIQKDEYMIILERVISEQDKCLEENRSFVEHLSSEVNTLNTDIGHLNSEVFDLNTEIGHLNSTVIDLNTEISHLNSEINNLNTDVGNLTLERNELNARVDELTLERSELIARVDELNSERNVLKSEVNDLIQNKIELQTMLDAYQRRKVVRFADKLIRIKRRLINFILNFFR